MSDKYKNFGELSREKKEGVDFDIELINRESPCAAIGIHGGNIELGTTEITRMLAGSEFSFYAFVGKKTEEESADLHITSSHFDEPKCLALVSKSEVVISIHGKSGEGEFVMVGGLDGELIKKISDSLKNAGFETRGATEDVNGNSPKNICNKCLSKKGVQLEISRGLRERLLNNKKKMEKFCEAIKNGNL